MLTRLCFECGTRSLPLEVTKNDRASRVIDTVIAGIYEMNMKYAGVWKKQRQHELKMMMTEAEYKTILTVTRMTK